MSLMTNYFINQPAFWQSICPRDPVAASAFNIHHSDASPWQIKQLVLGLQIQLSFQSQPQDGSWPSWLPWQRLLRFEIHMQWHPSVSGWCAGRFLREACNTSTIWYSSEHHGRGIAPQASQMASPCNSVDQCLGLESRDVCLRWFSVTRPKDFCKCGHDPTGRKLGLPKNIKQPNKMMRNCSCDDGVATMRGSLLILSGLWSMCLLQETLDYETNMPQKTKKRWVWFMHCVFLSTYSNCESFHNKNGLILYPKSRFLSVPVSESAFLYPEPSFTVSSSSVDLGGHTTAILAANPPISHSYSNYRYCFLCGPCLQMLMELNISI